MRRLYGSAAYGAIADGSNLWRQTVAAQPSDAPLRGEETCDVAIIGAGFTGLNAALRLRQSYGVTVRVLEAEAVGFGASGRAGGFCCLGGARLSARRLRQLFGAEDARVFHMAERAAVDHVADLLARHQIDADTHSDGETQLAHRPEAIGDLHAMGAEIKEVYGLTSPFIAREELADHGMASAGFHGALTVPIGFALNPLKYVTGLARVARDQGVVIHAGSPALSIREDGGGVRVTTPKGSLKAGKLLIATNGYSSEDVPAAMAGRYLPVPSAILATRPLTEEEIAAQGWSSLQMCHDTRTLLHYFRLMPDRRLMFGMRGATRTTPASMEQARAIARRDLARHFPAWAEVETPHFWSGFICFSRRFTPFAGAFPGQSAIFGAFGYHGNGIAMGSYTGASMADVMMGEIPSGPFPRFFAKPPGTFPLGRLRPAALPFAYQWYKWKDR